MLLVCVSSALENGASITSGYGSEDKSNSCSPALLIIFSFAKATRPAILKVDGYVDLYLFDGAFTHYKHFFD